MVTNSLCNATTMRLVDFFLIVVVATLKLVIVVGFDERRGCIRVGEENKKLIATITMANIVGLCGHNFPRTKP